MKSEKRKWMDERMNTGRRLKRNAGSIYCTTKKRTRRQMDFGINAQTLINYIFDYQSEKTRCSDYFLKMQIQKEGGPLPCFCSRGHEILLEYSFCSERLNRSNQVTCNFFLRFSFTNSILSFLFSFWFVDDFVD